MSGVVSAIREWLSSIADAWNRFWFQPAPPHTLAMIRVLGGAMLFYTHLVWSFDLEAFLGADSWISRDAHRAIVGSDYAWSYLWYLESPAALWTAHLLALAVFFLLTIGCFTRVVSVLSCLITLAYCHRLEGALYGLDQVNAMIAMYLMVGPSGAVYSVDAWWRRRGSSERPVVLPSYGANIAVRLLQVHLSIVYLFGGISKLKGTMWWDGSAVWFAVANYEYQSLDMTWLGAYPWFIAALTHLTVFWETFYPVLVWPRVTRPIMLGMAVCVHGGIALCLGMPTFGLAMIIANAAFLPPELVEKCVASFGGSGARVQTLPPRDSRTALRRSA